MGDDTKKMIKRMQPQKFEHLVGEMVSNYSDISGKKSQIQKERDIVNVVNMLGPVIETLNKVNKGSKQNPEILKRIKAKGGEDFMGREYTGKQYTKAMQNLVVLDHLLREKLEVLRVVAAHAPITRQMDLETGAKKRANAAPKETQPSKRRKLR